MDSLKKSGRPCKLDSNQKQSLINFIKNHPKLRYPAIKRETGVRVHSRTINRIANKAGLRTYRSIKRPNIKHQHQIKRLKLAKGLLKNPELIDKIIFTDEKKFVNSSDKNVEYVNRLIGAAYDEKNMRKSVSGSSIADLNVWAFIGSFGR